MPTIDRAQALRLADFHHWATDRVLDALIPATANQLDAGWGGSFGSARGLLQHVLGSERIWCERWNGRSATTRPVFPPAMSAHEFRGEWEKIKQDQRRVLDTLTDKRLASDLTFVNLKGDTMSF